jgi:hypothetical protein
VPLIKSFQFKTPSVELKMPKLEVHRSTKKRVFDPVRWKYEAFDPFKDVAKELQEDEGDLVKNNPKSDADVNNDYLAGSRTLSEILSKDHRPERLATLHENNTVLLKNARLLLESLNQTFGDFVRGELKSAEEQHFQSKETKEELETNARNSVQCVTVKNSKLSFIESNIKLLIDDYKTEDKIKAKSMKKGIFQNFEKIKKMRSIMVTSISQWKSMMPEGNSIQDFKRTIGQLKTALDTCHANRSPDEGDLSDKLYEYYGDLNDSCNDPVDLSYIGKVSYIQYLEKAHNDINKYYEHLEPYKSSLLQLSLLKQREWRLKEDMSDASYKVFKYSRRDPCLRENYYLLYDEINGREPEEMSTRPPEVNVPQQERNVSPQERNVSPRPRDKNVSPRPRDKNVPEWYRPQGNLQEEKQPQGNSQEEDMLQVLRTVGSKLQALGRWAVAFDPPGESS